MGKLDEVRTFAPFALAPTSLTVDLAMRVSAKREA
jgi:hypothetical protein